MSTSRDAAGWTIWIDTGGTFTDGLGLAPDGHLRRSKVLSSGALRGVVLERVGRSSLRVRTSWSAPADLCAGFPFRLAGDDADRGTVARYDPESSVLELSNPIVGDVREGTAFEVRSPEEAPVLVSRLLTRTPASRPLPVARLRLATTLGTNALLERRGVPVALFITEGFGDLLRIGTQARPELFTLDIRRPEPLYQAVVEVPERIGPDGAVERDLEISAPLQRAESLLRDGVRVAAVALMHGYRNPGHERRLGLLLKDVGFEHVSLSSDVAPSIKLVPRAETALVDAYLSPIVQRYLDRVGESLGDARLHVMTSAGGLIAPSGFRPKDSLLSGPAGGVVGAAQAGRRSGFSRLLAFDMGGTSTDVARFDRDYEYVFEQRVGDAHLVAPALAIESVAAGGGSICWFDGDRLRVGPESAGASPGPACYGAGGPLTITDVNLLLGRLEPGRFGIPIDRGAASDAFDAIRKASGELSGATRSESLLEGFLDIANERMSDAIRRISLRRGYDPADHALVAFGGAGPQCACGVAAKLEVETIVVPPDTGLLSAHGLGAAVLERFAERQVLAPLDAIAGRIDGWLAELETEARSAIAGEGSGPDEVDVRRRIAQLRFLGQEATVDTEIQDTASIGASFEQRYRELFGHDPGDRRVELVGLKVVVSTRPSEVERTRSTPATRSATPSGSRRGWFGGGWTATAEYERDSLEPGHALEGPALVLEDHSVTVVEPGWRLAVDAAGALVLRTVDSTRPTTRRRRPEAVRLELYTHRFETIAREMGERLRRTAVSTNVKERLDFSCAVLDPGGELLVNAPHIPVHLGALGLCVRHLRDEVAMAPGDVVVTNHPGYGGSHLPDVTVVTPVFTADDTVLGYVASRAHHAEIGGRRPGSMPPDATRLVEEGVVIPPTRVVRRGTPDWEAMRRLLTAPPWPTRALADNLADLEAAVAANHAGASALRRLADRAGSNVVRHYMAELKRLSGRRLREALGALDDGVYEAVERLDDGTPLAARIAIEGDRAVVDFDGSGTVHPGNLNATPAIVHSAVIYFLRLLVRRPIPLNEGLLEAVSIRIPEGILDPPFGSDPASWPAVVGGNVETSQRLVDALTRALGVAACSQGTMNNVLFGNDRFGYYETICGGVGGGPGFAGASAVHSNMTNTRITDPEVVEHRYPVRVERFGIRRGSGGAGKYPGGDGAVRTLRFLESVQLSVLTQHRVEAPFGLLGGSAGARGRQWVERADGRRVELGPVDGVDVGPGDRLVIETPGGGGFGGG